MWSLIHVNEKLYYINIAKYKAMKYFYYIF